MKRLFNHRKKPYEEEIEYDEWDDADYETDEGDFAAADSGEEVYDDPEAEYEPIDYESDFAEGDARMRGYDDGDVDETDGYYGYYMEAGRNPEESYDLADGREAEAYYADGRDAVEEEYYADGTDNVAGKYYAPGSGEADEEADEYYAAESTAADDEYYASGMAAADDEYYAAGMAAADDGHYAPGMAAADDEYYAPGTAAADDEYYAAESASASEDYLEEYYADNEDRVEYEEGYYAAEDAEAEEYYSAETFAEAEEQYSFDPDDETEGYYAQEDSEEDADSYYEADGGTESEEDLYYADDEEDEYGEEEGIFPVRRAKGKGGRTRSPRQHKDNVFLKLWNAFLEMSTMDRIITSTGVAVLVLALVTGGIYLSARLIDRQVSGFASVGRQLDGIRLIGEDGLLAVADAEKARQAAADAVANQEEDDGEEEEKPGYEEEEYTKAVTVSLSMTSIQKDLKIKFVNKKTGKLIANVPFSVNVKGPDGKSSTWEDDDMDGIIYKTEIAPGKYTVSVEELSLEKYKDYTLPASAQTAEVKKDIEYKKVDVKNEIKTESQVNVSKEDTKKNDTQVESKLTDTVTWVESTSTVSTYTEVAKNTIPDPMTYAFTGSFRRLAYVGTISPGSKTLNVGESFTVTASSEGVTLTDVKWSSSNPSVASVDEQGNVKAVGKGTAVISYMASGTAVSGGDVVTGLTGSCSVNVTETLGIGTVTVDNTSPAVLVGGSVAVKAVASNFTAGKELIYAASSNRADIATVSVDAAGNVTIKGVAAGEAAITVTADYKEGGSAGTKATVVFNVKVTGNKTITLDKTAATVYVGTPVTINAVITNAVTQAAVTAESSDTNVASVSVNGRAVTISGLKAGSATITVKYSENGEEVKAACTVTVKASPKEDRTNKLKDSSGNQLYVLENNQYREAVYADYYTAAKFFIKGAAKYTGWQTIDGKVYFFDANGNKVTGEQVIQGAKYNFGSDGALITGNGTRGIDVSKWNGNIDWAAVKNSGIEYVIIRCGYRGSSQGALIEDPKYAANIKGASAAGLKVGVYFFTQAVNEAEAVEEASMVLELVQNYKITYPIFLDVEGSGGRGDKIDKATRTAVCKAFAETIQKAGYTAGIYANKTWFTNKIDASQLSAYKIWLAQYAAAPTYTGRYDLWQYQSTGKVSGISGNVDMNWSYLGY